MQFGPDFYRRRLDDRLAPDRAEDGQAAGPPAPLLLTEAAVLSIADDAEFIRQAYLAFLDREPDVGGFRYFCDMLEKRGRQVVLDEIRNSEEGRRLAPSAQDPTPPPDPEMLANATPELADLLSIADDEKFVTAAYLRTLGRRPDPHGSQHQLARLRQGVPRELLLHGLATSPEATERGRQFTWKGQPWRGPSLRARARAAMLRARRGGSSRLLEAAVEETQRAQAQLERRLDQQRSRYDELERALLAIQHTLDEVRSEVPTRKDVEALVQSFSSAIDALSGSLTPDLRRLRAGLEALRDTTEALAARTERESAGPAMAAIVAGDNVGVTLIDGLIVAMPGEEWRLVAHHAFRGVLEPGLTRLFCESVKPGMVVVDIGANFGIYTLFAARLVGPDGKVYSFEPTPRTFAILKDNIQVNGLLETGRVDLRRVAVTDRRGSARFAVYPGNSGHNTLFPGDRDTELIEVETVGLDDALADVSHVDVIKIDAEGAEPVIWAGMTGTLARSPQVRIFMEFAPGHLRRAGHDPAAFLDRIEASGFDIQRVNDETGAVVACTREELGAVTSTNLMLTRAGT